MNENENKKIEKFTIEKEAKEPPSKWIILIPCALLFCQMLSFVLVAYVLNQYNYFIAMKSVYGNQSHFQPSGQSGCSTNTSSLVHKQQIVITKLTTNWATYVTIATNIPAVFVTLNYASYSDVYGRKWFFVPPFVGLVIKIVLCMVGVRLLILFKWFALFHVVEGLTGVWISTFSITFCFVADTTKPGKWRAVAIGIVEMCVGLAVVVGQFLSGYLIKTFNGFLQPLGIALGFAVFGLILSIVIVPETLPKEKRRKSIKFYDQARAVFQFYFTNVSQIGKRWMYILCMLIFLFSILANLGKITVEVFYQLNEPFCWNSVKIGYYGAFRTVTNQMFGLVLIRLLLFCTNDEYIALIGLVASFSSMVLEGFAKTDTMMYLVPVIGIGSFMTMPMIRSIMSKITPPDRQGAMNSGIAAVEATCNMLGLTIANLIYGRTVGIFRGLVFFVLSSYVVVAAILNIFIQLSESGNKVRVALQSVLES